MLPTLVRPLYFQRRNRGLFPTYACFRYYLTNRRENGLLESGAVVETQLGLRVVPAKFPDWLLKRPPQDKAS